MSDLIKKEREKKLEYQRNREANYFAMALLMPKELILQNLKIEDSGGVSEEEIVRMAELFKVSIVAMTLRLVQLEILMRKIKEARHL